ncbi:MAG: hypothetical protein EOL93_05835 [Epsilonproteobacteria bacterium]|nr:hypothetical protein [Campylobacterota bacterium]
MINKIKIFTLLILLGFSFSSVNAEESISSVRTYSHFDEQKAFNLVKKIFRTHSSEKYIIDTSWEELHITERSASGYFNLTTTINHLVLKVEKTMDHNHSIMHLELYKTSDTDEIKHYIPANEFSHELLWNRLEYGLGLNNEWINCFTLSEFLSFTYPLCAIDKESLQP